MVSVEELDLSVDLGLCIAGFEDRLVEKSDTVGVSVVFTLSRDFRTDI